MGAYFTDRQGNTRYVADDAEYKRLDDAEWGGSGEGGSSTATQEKPEKEDVKIPKLGSMDGEPAPEEPTRIPDKWRDVGSQIRQGFAKGVQKVAPSDERAEAIAEREELIEANKADDPLLKDEALPGAYRTVQSALDGLVSLPLQLSESGYLDPSYITKKLGLSGFINTITGGQPDWEKQLHAQYEANQEEIKQYGRVDGQPLGWREGWLGGQYLSKDSDFYKKNKPESEIVDLGAQIVGVIGTAGGIRKGLTWLGMARTGTAAGGTFNVMQGIPTTVNKPGFWTSAGFFLRASAPEMAEELVLWPPNIPELSSGYEEQLEIWNRAATPKDKLALKRLFLSENSTEFNYHKAQVQQALMGGAIVGAGKWTWNILSNVLDVSWTALRNIKLGEKASKAWDNAYNKFKPDIETNVKGAVDEGIQLELNLGIGKTTTDFDATVGKDIPEITTGARESAETFLVKTKNALDAQADISKNIDLESTSIPEQRAALVEGLKASKKKLQVSSEASIIAKTKLLDKRAAAYRVAQENDPDWLLQGKPARGEAPNQRRLRLLNNAIEEMKRLEEIEIKLEELEAKELEFLAQNSAYRNAQSQQLEASNDFQKFITETQQQLSKEADLLDARNAAVNMDNVNKTRLGEVVEPDTYGTSNTVLLHGEVKALLDEAQAAIDNNQVSPEFLNDWIRRFEEVNVTAVDEGVSAAPIKAVGSQPAPDEGLLGPKTSPTEIPVPVDKDGLVDDALINQGIDLSDEMPLNVTRKADNVLEQLQEALGTNKQAKGIEALNEIGDDVDQLIEKLDAAKKFDDANGTNTFADELEIFRAANAKTYTPDMSDQALLKVVNDRVVRNKSIDSVLSKALLEMGQFIDDPQGAAQLSYLVKEGMINRQNVRRLSAIPVQLSLLDANVKNAMSSLRIYQNVKSGASNETTLEAATALALNDIDFLVRSVKAVDPLAQYLGTGLGLFRRKLRLKFPTRAAILERIGELNPDEKWGDAYKRARWELIANEWNTTIANLPNPEELLDKMSHTAKTASERFEATMGNTLKKLKKGEALNGEEMADAMSIMDAVYKSGGNWNNLNQIDKTWSGVMNQIITSGTMSNPRGPFGIVVAGFSQAIPTHVSGYVMGNITKKLLRFAGREELVEGTAKRADLQYKWLKGYLYGFMNSWDGFSKRMIFPEAHPDYVKNPISLLNQQAKLDDLAVTKFDIKTPFGKWAVNKTDFEKPEVYNLINYGRVWMKSMHDNAMSGSDWEKLPAAIKGWRLPGSKEGSKRIIPGLGAPIQIGREFGFGKTPYYAKGEEQSMTAVLKSLSWGDSFFTEVSGNAFASATVRQQVAEEIADGLLKPENAKAEIIKRLNKKTSELFEPIHAGVDQKIVGYQIRDNQFQSFKDFINLTEEITDGPIGDMKSAIDTLKKSDNPALSGFATTLMPVTTSAFNWLKNVVRITSGYEAFRGAKDLARLGAKVTKDQVAKHLPEEVVETLRKSPVGVKWLENAKQFESVYLHSDPIIRERAQQALGMTVAFHSAAFALVWGLDGAGWESTGPMTHTYREAKGLKKPFHLRLEVPFMDFPGIDAIEVPYMYFGAFGGTLALHSTARDLMQFGNADSAGDIVMLGIAAQARQAMEIPTLAGPDKITDALAKAGDGNLKPLQRIIAEAVSKVGSPTLGYERDLKRLIFKGKKAGVLENKLTPQYYKKGKWHENVGNFAHGVTGTLIGTLGYRFEDTGVGDLVDAISSVIANDPTIWKASRQAMPFGKPGEVIEWSDLPRFAMPIESITGRIFPINSKVDDDKVRQARLDNLIPPIDRNLFSSESDGQIGLSDTAVNELNHFLNEDALFISPWTGKTHVGIHAFITEIVNRPEYKQLSGADVVSPYRTGNWDRKNSTRADWIKSLIRNQINIVKWQWVDGEEYPQQIPDPKAPGGFRQQRWFADPELRELINSRKKD